MKTRAELPPNPGQPAASYVAGSLRVDEYGRSGKPAVVFIPSLGCGPWSWYGQIRKLAPDYKIYALTLPGFDGSPPVKSRKLFGVASGDFWKFIARKHVGKPVVVGHSIGGTFAILLAEQHPARLRAAVCVDGLPAFAGTARQRDEVLESLTARLSVKTRREFEEMERNSGLPGLITSKAQVSAAAALVAKSNPGAVLEWVKQMLWLDLRPGLPRVSVPLLAIVPFDPKIDPKPPLFFKSAGEKKLYYARLFRDDSAARVVMVQPSRHFVMLDQPEQLYHVLRGFLASVLPASHH